MNWLDSQAPTRPCNRVKSKSSVRLRHLIRALYLDLAGVPQAAIEKALNGANRDSQYLIQLNNAEHRRRHPQDTGGALLHIDVKDASSPDDKAS